MLLIPTLIYNTTTPPGGGGGGGITLGTSSLYPFPAWGGVENGGGGYFTKLIYYKFVGISFCLPAREDTRRNLKF